MSTRWGILEALAHVHEWRPATAFDFYFRGSPFAMCDCGAAYLPSNLDMADLLEAVRCLLGVPGPSSWEGV